MKRETWLFWLAVLCSLGWNMLAFGFFCLVLYGSGENYTPPQELLAYGDSDVEGLSVGAVSLDPGTLRTGDMKTPGGDDQPEKTLEEPEPSEGKTVEPLAPPTPVEAMPSRDDQPPALVVPKPAAAEDKSSSTKLPGSPGGARLPQGTPSAGGKVGSRNGVRMIEDSLPPYPRAAREQGIEGRVVILLTISVDGVVTDAVIRKSSGYAILDEAALRHSRTRRFVPARANGLPVACTALYPVTFELTGYR